MTNAHTGPATGCDAGTSARARDVELLLGALLLSVPDPRTWSSRDAQPGEAAVKRARCPACDGTGQRRVRGFERACDAPGCSSGFVMVDPQTTRRALEPLEDEPREMTSEERSAWEGVVDAKLEQVAAMLRQHAGVEAAPGPMDRSVIRRDRLDALGSFVELRSALDWLRDTAPLAHRLVVQFLVHRWPCEPSPAVRRVLDTACELLALRMPVPIRVPGFLRAGNDWRPRRESLHHGRTERHEAQRCERRSEVDALYVQGRSTEEIALRFGLSESQVRRIRSPRRCNGEAA